MTELRVLQQSTLRRAEREARLRRRRRRRRLSLVVLTPILAIAAVLVFMTAKTSGPSVKPAHTAHAVKPHHSPLQTYATTAAPVTVHPRFRKGVRGALLFDLRTGHVLWQRNAGLRLPIASLTKMMTAVLVVAHSKPRDRVLITRQAVHYTGSGVGVLPLNRRASELTLLYGLLLPSGNDAAIALAQHVAGTERRFVALMNSQARTLGLTCTRFSSVSGIVDQGNYSCARDLARLTHVLLQRPLLARIVSTRSAVMPLPVKGGKVYLYNNNPLLLMRFPGTDGVKTGYTVAAGRCLVATVHRGHRRLGVVLLNSADPPDQAKQLFELGFRAESHG
jgi:serine-type D-Ala-D-Ala carboxypeptidase (penicillin-binding protein 5/6)